MKTKQQIFNEELAKRELKEYQEVLLAINSIIQTEEGKKFFKYMFKNLDVGTVPERGIEGFELHDYLGFLRAGNSIYKLACEADYEIAALLLAKLEKEKYDDIIEQHRIESSVNE